MVEEGTQKQKIEWNECMDAIDVLLEQPNNYNVHMFQNIHVRLASIHPAWNQCVLDLVTKLLPKIWASSVYGTDINREQVARRMIRLVSSKYKESTHVQQMTLYCQALNSVRDKLPENSTVHYDIRILCRLIRNLPLF